MVITMQLAEKENALYPYWVFQNVLSPEMCEQIINLGKNRWMQGKIVEKSELDKGKVDTKTRKTDVAFSNDDWLYEVCWSYLNTANRNSNWNFEISSCEPMQ